VTSRRLTPPEDIAQLYRGTSRRLLGVLVAAGASREEAEEVIHDAYLKLIPRWSRVSKYDDPEAWVRTVAMRNWISLCRRRSTAQRLLPLVGARSREGGGESDATEVAVLAAVGQLPIDQRAVIAMFYYLDLDIQMIGRSLGVSPGTVKSRLARARTALKRQLGEESEVLK
jgi:RNA polymerase sigma factor (sigma-70 family)